VQSDVHGNVYVGPPRQRGADRFRSLFGLAGIAAGVLRYPVLRFLPFCWQGKTIKTLAFAFAGAYSLTFFEQFL